MKRISSYLLSPWTILLSATIGFVIGFVSEGNPVFKTGAEIYLSLLRISVLPILVTAVVSSMGALFARREGERTVGRLLAIFALSSLGLTILGLAVGSTSGLGQLKRDNPELGRQFTRIDIESYLNPASVDEQASAVVAFFVPENVVKAASSGNYVALLIFSLVLGTALGVARTSESRTTLIVAEALFDAFLKIMHWIVMGLPLGLVCIVATEVSRHGLRQFQVLTGFALEVCLISVSIVSLCLVLMSKTVGSSLLRTVKSMKEPLYMALATSSSYIALPYALRAMKRLRRDPHVVKVVIPVGVNLNPAGSAMYFAMIAIWVSQLHGVSLGPMQYALIGVSAIGAGMVATGTPGTGALAMIGFVLGGVGLPAESGFILLSVAGPFIDRFVTAVNVSVNCLVACVVANHSGERPLPTEAAQLQSM